MIVTEDRRGRPRSSSIDERLHESALSLLSEVGWEGFTMDGLARRAKVSRVTVYSRYASKDEAVVHALSAVVPPLDDEGAGDPRARLEALVANLLVPLSAAPWGRAVLAVHAASTRSPNLVDRLREEYWSDRESAFLESLDAVRAAGWVLPSEDAREVRDLLFGPLVYRWLVDGELITRESVRTHLATLCAVRR